MTTSTNAVSGQRKVLLIASTDSYLKWVAATASKLPNGFEFDLVQLRSSQNPSRRQIDVALLDTAFEGTVPRVISLSSLKRYVANTKPELVVLGVTGPSIELVRLALDGNSTTRSIPLISGFPGIAIGQPAEWTRRKALVDILIAQSLEERKIFEKRVAGFGMATKVSLGTFPFTGSPSPLNAEVSRIVFAAQPSVPPAKAERAVILSALEELAVSRPDLQVVVKVRGNPNDPQTHHEEFSYQELHREFHPNGRVQFEGGSMMAALEPEGSALLTVSSTAVLEAIHLGKPAALIGDFGIRADLSNKMFEGSDLFIELGDLEKIQLVRANKQWLEYNYFHLDKLNDLAETITNLGPSSRSALPIKALAQPHVISEAFRLYLPKGLANFLIALLTRFKKEEQ